MVAYLQRRRPRVAGLLCGAAWLLGVLSGCSGGSDSGDVPATREAISIGVPKEPLGALIIIAHEKGYFADAGLDVSIVGTYPSGKRALQAMLDRKVSLTISSEVPLMLQSFERHEFRILATIGTSDNEPRIIARKDKGIEKPVDLSGKKVATQRGSAVHYFLDLFLLRNGIGDVEIEFMKAEQLPPALADAKIDAFSMREPFIGQAKELLGEENAAVFAQPGVYQKTMNLVCLTSLVEESPAAIEKVLRALQQAETFARKNHDEATRIVADKLAIDAAQLSKAFEDVELELMLGHSLLIALEDEAVWAIKNGLTEHREIPDFLKLISAEPMKNVKPSAVTIVE